MKFIIQFIIISFFIGVINAQSDERDYDEELSCLITSSHQIPVGEFTFWDWED